MHKTLIGVKYNVASRSCCTKAISYTISKIFKMTFSYADNIIMKRFFYSSCKKFWLVQNSFPIFTKLNKIEVEKKVKSISTYDFSTLLTSILDKLLIHCFQKLLISSSNLLVYQWVLIQQHFGSTSSFIFFESKNLKQLISNEVSRFIFIDHFVL